ncbi:hypothetical protein PG996_010731 [Apiospora saccharicola]|uniref:Uncharacterized protein n=1 Tax=Apiospora saccharicola TaxID=335842 RepID=A0ABR1URV2_9PEZI
MHTQQTLFLLAAAGATFTEARPSSSSPAPRQVNGGSLECNTARVRIVAGLQETRTNVNQIVDVTTRGTANDGINLASNAINSIAIAVLTGTVPPADARQITEGGSTSRRRRCRVVIGTFFFSLFFSSYCCVILLTSVWCGMTNAELWWAFRSDPAVGLAQVSFAEAVAAAFDVVDLCT